MNVAMAGLWIVIAAALAGCAPAVMKSVRQADEVAEKNANAGFKYYLPKRLVKVQFDRAPAPTAKQVEKAKGDHAAAQAAEKKAKEVADEMLKLRDRIAMAPGGTTSAAYLEQAKLTDIANANLAIAKENTVKANDALNAANANDFLANKGKPPLMDTLTLTLTGPVADRDAGFVAMGQHVMSRSDTLTLKTNTSGLLTNAEGTTEDQTASIIVALAGTIAAGSSPSLFGGTTWSTEARKALKESTPPKCGGYGEPPAEPTPFSIEYVLDPLKDIASAPANGTLGALKPFELMLCSLGAPYRLQLAPLFEAGEGGTKQPPQEGGGLYYRRELPYLLSVFRTEADGTGAANRLAKAVLFTMPNGSPREFLPLEGGAFTTRTHTTVFDNGMLVSHTESKPSELLAVARIPIDVLKAIFTIPTELITLKFNYVEGAQELAGAEKALLDAARALEAARKQ